MKIYLRLSEKYECRHGDLIMFTKTLTECTLKDNKEDRLMRKMSVAYTGMIMLRTTLIECFSNVNTDDGVKRVQKVYRKIPKT